MKENDYRILITSIFGNDTFINEITVALEYNYPILTQDVLPTKKQISISSSSSNNEQSSSSNIKKKQIENCQKGGTRVQKFRETNVNKTKTSVHKKE